MKKEKMLEISLNETGWKVVYSALCDKHYEISNVVRRAIILEDKDLVKHSKMVREQIEKMLFAISNNVKIK